VLPVRADEEERVLDDSTGEIQVEPEEVVVAVELEAPQLAPRFPRARDVGDEAFLPPVLGPADKQEPSMRVVSPLR